MTLKPRRSKQRSRVGWASIKTTRGWGLQQVNRDSVLSLFGKKRFVLGIIVIAVIVAGIILAQPGVQSVKPGSGDPDVVSQLWNAPDASGNGNDFGYNIRASYGGTNGALWTSNSNIDLNPNGTANNGYAVALAKVGFDPSTVSGKLLKFIIFYKIPTLTSWPDGSTFDIYFTRNSTLPTQSGYDPLQDKAVGLVNTIYRGGSSTNFNLGMYVQKVQTETIASEDTGCSGGSHVACELGIPNAFFPVTAQVMQESFYLNFTGASTAVPATCSASGSQPIGGNGCNSMIGTQSGTITPYTGQTWTGQSGFQFQATTYYVGFWFSGFANVLMRIGFDNNMGQANAPCEIDPNNNFCSGQHSQQVGSAVVNAPAPVAIPGPVDTGGFFGPVIKALISIGVFIVSNIISFFAYLGGLVVPVVAAVIAQLANAIKLALNAIGSFFGWGALGDSLFTFTNAVVSAVTQTLAAIASDIGDIVNRVLNFLTIVSTISGQIFGGSGLLANLFTLASNSFTQLVTIFSKLILLGSPALTVAVYLSYFDAVATGGLAGFASWWNFMRWLAFGFINVTVTIINRAVMAITDLISYIPTIAAHMPEQGLPAVPTLQNTNFPGFPITGAGTKFREGDFGAVALFLFGGGLLMALLALNVPGVNPLANLTAASGCNPTACFNTAFQSVFLPFTTVFTLVIFAGFATQVLFAPVGSGDEGPLIRIVEKKGFSQKAPRGLKRSSERPRGRAFERRVVARADRFIQAEYGSQNE